MFFEKYEGNPVFGGPERGVCFDVYVTHDGEKYRMDFSWRDHKSLAVAFSDDGVHFGEPIITLAPDPASAWEDEHVNRNCVLKIDGVYKMWYTGQSKGKSYIGYAESADGIHFTRMCKDPVLSPETDFEKDSVMNPCVLYENGVYRMWYAAGETYEPNVLCYAESTDGIHFKKYENNPIFGHGEKEFEKDRVGGCQVIRTEDMGYLMFYIGYKDIDTACICAAKSPDGIHDFVRSKNNPMVTATPGTWDEDSVYKPSMLYNGEKDLWTVWFNGRRGTREYVGCATRHGRPLF